MRTAARLTLTLLPFVVLACGGGADERVASTGQDLSTHVHPEDDPAGNVACDAISMAAGAPGACEVVGDALSILQGAQSIQQLLGGGTDESAQILQAIQGLSDQMNQIDTDVKGFWSAFNNFAYQSEQQAQITEEGLIQQHEADAKDAAVRLAEWVGTGRSNSLLIASIDQESSQAAMSLTNTAYYYRAGATQGAANIFDLRMALPSYLYALTVRLAVIGAEDPNFRCANDIDGLGCTLPYQQELQTHIAFLQSLVSLNAPNIRTTNQTQTGEGEYTLCSLAEDLNSSYTSMSNFQGNPPTGVDGPSECVGPRAVSAAQASDTLQYLEFWDLWNVQEEMGIHAIEAMTNLLTTANTPDYPLPVRECVPLNGHTCPTPYSSLGPLVSNTGLCLTDGADFYGLHEIYTGKCSNGASTQTWQTAGMGATAQLQLTGPNKCLEVDDWSTNSPVEAICSGSPGEAYTVTAANELRWSRDETQCLTAGTPTTLTNAFGQTAAEGTVTLQPCDGQAHQQWSRAWPLTYIPIPIHAL